MRKAEIVMAGLLALLSVYLMWKSGEVPAWTGEPRFSGIGYVEGEGPGTGFWPFWMAAAMLVSCVWIAINWLRRSSPQSRSTDPYLDSYGVRMLATVGGGVVGFVALIPFVGMYGAIPAFMLYYMVYLGRHGWVQSLTISLLAPVVTFFFFDVAMRVPLPKGYTEPLFLPLYEIFLKTN